MRIVRRIWIAAALLAGSAWFLAGQTAIDLSRQGKLGSGTLLPAHCVVGQVFFMKNTPPGANLYLCTAQDVWTVVGIAAGLGANRPVSCSVGQIWLATDSGAMTYCSAPGNPGTWSATIAGPSGPAGPQGPTGAQGAPGLMGPAGATGMIGPQGPTGPSGAAGAPGTNGNSVWSGTAPPPAAIGANGDFFIANPATAPCIYGPKGGGVWPGTCVSLVGPAGTAGLPGQGFTWKGIWSTTATYGPYDTVSYLGSSYVAVSASQGVQPATDVTKWNVLAQQSASALASGTTNDLQKNGGQGVLVPAVPGTDFQAPPTALTTSGSAPICDLGTTGAVSRCEQTLSGDVVAAFAHLKAGEKFSWAWTQPASNGPYSVTYSGATNACSVSPTAGTMTVQEFEVGSDGASVVGVGCSTNETTMIIRGPTGPAPQTPDVGLVCWSDSAANNWLCKDANGRVFAAVLSAGGASSHQFVTYIDSSGVQHTAQASSSDLADAANLALLNTNQTVSGNKTFTGVLDCSGCAHSIPARIGTASNRPATCSVGEEYFATDASAGQNKYFCTASNVWTQQAIGGGSGSGTVNPGNSGQLAYYVSNGSAVSGGPTGHNLTVPLLCLATSGSSAAYTCATSPGFTPGSGDKIVFRADIASGGPATLAVNGAVPVPIRKQGGSMALVANDILAGQYTDMVFDGAAWQLQGQLGNASSSSAVGCQISSTGITLAGDVLDSTCAWAQDEFDFGSSTSGSIGRLGWSSSGNTAGTIYANPSYPNHPGNFVLATNSTTAPAQLYAPNGISSNPTNWGFQFQAQFFNSTAVTYKIGLAQGSALPTNYSSTPAYLGVRYDTSQSDVDFMIELCTSSATSSCTAVDSGVPFSTGNSYTFYVYSTVSGSASVSIKTNAGPFSTPKTVCASGCNLTASNFNSDPVFWVKALTSSTVSLLIDRFAYVIAGMGR